MQKLTIQGNEAGQRLDKFLSKYMREAPKSFLYKMLRKKNITLNGKKAQGLEKLSVGDEITLFLSDETIEKFQGEKNQNVNSGLNLEIVYEDEQVLFINKPVGILSQRARKEDVSVVEFVQSHVGNERAFHAGICNRLDRNTSGLIVAGKTLSGLQILSKMILERSVKKYYLCIVRGTISSACSIEGFLEKDEEQNKVSIVTKGEASQKIRTEYAPVVANSDYTLLKVDLITGKTHQIRAHLASIGHPLIGDAKYGDSIVNQEMKRRFHLRYQLLHAYEMRLPKMEGEMQALSGKIIQAPLPKEFRTIQKELGLETNKL